MPHRKCPHCLLPSSTARPPLLDEAPPMVMGPAQGLAWLSTREHSLPRPALGALIASARGCKSLCPSYASSRSV